MLLRETNISDEIIDCFSLSLLSAAKRRSFQKYPKDNGLENEEYLSGKLSEVIVRRLLSRYEHIYGQKSGKQFSQKPKQQFQGVIQVSRKQC